jgi:AmmeMemoRadiSam system protein B
MSQTSLVGALRILAAGSITLVAFAQATTAQIPMEQVLKRITVPSTPTLRGLVDVVGFPQTPDQMTFIGDLVERLEKDAMAENQRRLALNDQIGLAAAWCPHDDYMIAARAYAHVQRYMRAKTIILIGNAHWAQTFGIRGKLIFDDFAAWRGPYSPVAVSAVRGQILKRLQPASYVVDRQVVETEHSLEALIPYLQYYNRRVEIVPILVPLMTWDDSRRVGRELADVVASIMRENGWALGRDIAVLCSGDGQHYGDYGWSYYDYHPYGVDAEAYQKALTLDRRLADAYLVGELRSDRLQALSAELIDQQDITRYRITWCGRFAVPFGLNFAGLLARTTEGRGLNGMLLRTGSSISDPWLPLEPYKLGLTGDANLHHFVTYLAVGYR